MKFNERLKELRKDKGLTQKELAKILNVTDDCIYFWEKGRSEPSISQIVLISTYFEISSDYLLGIKDY